MTSKERIENAIHHIQTATDIDPWAMEIAVDAMQSMVYADDDIISRRAAIDALNDEYHGMISDESMKIYQIIKWLEELPSAQPEIKPIEYRDCADAMLRMWMDNVVTDGEYNRIIDKLNAHWGKEG